LFILYLEILSFGKIKKFEITKIDYIAYKKVIENLFKWEYMRKIIKECKIDLLTGKKKGLNSLQLYNT